MKVFTKCLLLIVFVLLSGFIVFSHEAHALGEPTDTIPNNGVRDIGPTTPWMVTATGDMRAPATFVLIYVPSSQMSFTVNLINGCSTPLDTYDGGSSSGRTLYAVSTTDSAGRVGPAPSQLVVSPHSASNCNGDMTLASVPANPAVNPTHTVNVNGTVYKVYRLDAIANTSISTFYENQFRVNVPGGLVGFSSLTDTVQYLGNTYPYWNSIYSWRDSSSTSDVAGDTQQWGTTVAFSPTCSFGSGNANISLYDIDSTEFESNNPMHYRLYQIDKATGVKTLMSPGGEGDLTGTGTGNNQTKTLTFNFNSQYRYEFEISSISRRNSFQFTIPFDQINASNNCGPAPSISCSVIASATLEPGNYTPTVSVTYTAGSSYPSATVNTTVVVGGSSRAVNGTVIPINTTASVGGFSPPYNLGPGVHAINASVSGSAGSTALGPVPCGGATSVTVVAKPYFKVYNGSVRVGSGFDSGVETCETPAPGSAGRVQAYARSASHYSGASSQFDLSALGQVYESFYSNGASPTSFKGLTLSNTASSGTYGGILGGDSCITDYYSTTKKADIPTVSGNTTFAGLNVAAGAINQVEWTGGGTVTGGHLTGGDKLVVYATGNVYITPNNITMASTYNSLADIPFFALIVKGNIMIAPGVTQLDGIYIAQPDDLGEGGGIYTCATSPTTIPAAADIYATCNNPLTFNGMVIAKKIKLLRTRGTLQNGVANEPATSGNIAEVFNGLPELYLADPAFNVDTSASKLYDSVTSLPPLL